MQEETQKTEDNNKDEQIAEPLPESGPVSKWLSENGYKHKVLEPDHLGVEMIGIEPMYLYSVASALKKEGFDYLQCQGGYDEGPGENLVSFYHLISIENQLQETGKLKEVRLKVFLARDGDLTVKSLYKLFQGADWQERETFDMFGINFEGHPHPKRLLMPEDWKGWPLRKDYVQPDFYEMQDAY